VFDVGVVVALMVIYVMVARHSCNSSGRCLSCDYAVVVADTVVIAVLLS